MHSTNSPQHQNYGREHIVSAWLNDVLAASPTGRPPHLPSPPSSPASLKRKATRYLVLQHYTKRRVVLVEQDTDTVMHDECLTTPRPRNRTGASQGGETDFDAEGPKNNNDSNNTSSTSSWEVDENGNSGEDMPQGSPTPRRNEPRSKPTLGCVANKNTHNDYLHKSSATQTPIRPGDLQSANTASFPSSYAGAIATGAPFTLFPSDASSTRSNSPVKGMSDLGLAAKPVKSMRLPGPEAVPDDVKELFEAILLIDDSEHVVPAAIRNEFDALASKLAPFKRRPLKPENLDETPTARSKIDLIVELEILGGVVRETEDAMADERAEAHWNDRVHSPVLVAAIERDRGEPSASRRVSVFNSTVAAIAPGCIPRHAAGFNLQAKMVDYCIAISSPEVERVARGAVAAHQQRARQSAASSTNSLRSASSISSASHDGDSSPNKKRKRVAPQPPPPPQSINHTAYHPLCLRPISVSIETKKSGGSENLAKAQLSVWVSAQILRFRQLTGSPSVGITLPLLYVNGRTWQIMFAVDLEEEIVILQSFLIDGTDTLLGCYRVVALLRALRTWSETTFRDWFVKSMSEAVAG